MTEYITKSGDTWDMIAKAAYNDEARIDILMQANFHLLDYFIFPEGIKVVIPPLPEKSWEIPEWRS